MDKIQSDNKKALDVIKEKQITINQLMKDIAVKNSTTESLKERLMFIPVLEKKMKVQKLMNIQETIKLISSNKYGLNSITVGSDRIKKILASCE